VWVFAHHVNRSCVVLTSAAAARCGSIYDTTCTLYATRTHTVKQNHQPGKELEQ
jgi:hypothetical protein